MAFREAQGRVRARAGGAGGAGARAPRCGQPSCQRWRLAACMRASADPSALAPSWCACRWYEKGVAYWEGVAATVDGVLGGFGHVSGSDVRESKEFAGRADVMGQLLQEARGGGARRLAVLDCGAGVGRVTKVRPWVVGRGAPQQYSPALPPSKGYRRQTHCVNSVLTTASERRAPLGLCWP